MVGAWEEATRGAPSEPDCATLSEASRCPYQRFYAAAKRNRHIIMWWVEGWPSIVWVSSPAKFRVDGLHFRAHVMIQELRLGTSSNCPCKLSHTADIFG